MIYVPVSLYDFFSLFAFYLIIISRYYGFISARLSLTECFIICLYVEVN